MYSIILLNEPFLNNATKLSKLLVVLLVLFLFVKDSKIFNISSWNISLLGHSSRHSSLYSQVNVSSSVQFLTHLLLELINL